MQDPTDCQNYTNFINNCDNTNGIQFPMAICDIPKFVELNYHLNLNINVFLYFLNDVAPIANNIISKKSDQANLEEINLLLVYPNDSKIDDAKSNENPGHFMLIKNLSKFLSKRHSSVSRTDRYICHKCLRGFSRQDMLDDHKYLCTNKKSQIGKS